MATYPIWQGYANSWVPDYEADPPVCTLSASDGFKPLGAGAPSGPSASVGSGELSGARISRLLDAGGWSSTDRLIGTGNAAMQATTLAQPWLQEIQQVVLAELGSLYMNESGEAQFDPRHTYMEAARSNTVQWTFSDDPNVSGMPYVPAPPIFDDLLVRNSITAQILGGIVQSATDATSAAKYFTRVLNQTGLLLTSDSEALNWATWLLYLLKNPENRFDTISVAPASGEFPTLSVQAGFNLSPASPYLQFDDPIRGKFDTGQFGPATGVWTELANKVVKVTTAAGKARLLDQYQMGQMTGVFSMIGGDLDPNNTAGAYASGGVTYLQPETPIRVVATYSGSDPRWLAVLGAKFHDRCRIVKKPWVAGQASIDQQSFIESKAHTILPGNSWTTSLGQVSATRFGVPASFLIFDDPTLGKFGTGAFAGW